MATEAVSSAEQAKQRLHGRHVDLIVYDAESPPADRAKTLQLLAKRARKQPGLRVIVISDSQPQHAPGLGVKEFEWIERPLDEAHMLAIVCARLFDMSKSETSKDDSSVLPPPVMVKGADLIPELLCEALGFDPNYLRRGLLGRIQTLRPHFHRGKTNGLRFKKSYHCGFSGRL